MKKITDYSQLQESFCVPLAAIAFLQAASAETPNGRYTFGEGCFINVMDCTTKSELGMMEAHERFVDVQCLLTGEEKILYASKNDLPITENHYAEKDVAFYTFKEALEVCYRAGEGIVLLPDEAHLPGRAVQAPMAVKKAVMKLDYLALRR